MRCKKTRERRDRKEIKRRRSLSSTLEFLLRFPSCRTGQGCLRQGPASSQVDQFAVPASWRQLIRARGYKTPYLVIFPDFTDKIAESLIYVDPLLRRCFDEFATKMLGKVTALCVNILDTMEKKCWKTRTVHADLSFVF